MVGSLDISSKCAYTPQFEDLTDSHRTLESAPAQSTYMGFMREPLGLPVNIHLCNLYTGATKLQFLDMPSRTLAECWQIVEQIFEGIADAKVVRLHLGADLIGVPMEELRKARVPFKKNSLTYSGPTKQGTINQVETLQFGSLKSGNGYTIYDKVAERRYAYTAARRHMVKYGLPPQTFEEFSGFASDAVVSRIERKFGKGKIPTRLDTFMKLATNLLTYNPFDTLTFCPVAESWPNLDLLGLNLYRKVVAWRADLSQFGFDGAYRRLGKNAWREYQQIKEAEAACSTNTITAEHLLAVYREEITRQLEGWEKLSDFAKYSAMAG